MQKVQMIKMKDKFVPAEFKDGKWVPIENAELQYGADGKLAVVKKEKEKKDETDSI